MTIGAPIDASIRRIVIKSRPINNGVPDSQGNLDPAPQLIMEPGDEQFSFQYDDGLGDGRDKYEGYNDAGSGAASQSAGATITDTISFHIEKPKNKTYVLSYNVPFPIEILGNSHEFLTGSGTVSFQSGTVNTNGDLQIIVSGLSTSPAAEDLLGQITVRTNQVG